MKKAYIAPSIDKYLVQNTVMLEGSETLTIISGDADPTTSVLSKQLINLDVENSINFDE